MDPSILIAAVPPTLVGLAAFITSVRARSDVQDAQAHAEEAARLMKGNGKGTVPVMLEKLLDMQTDHEVKDDVRFATVNARLKSLGSE